MKLLFMTHGDYWLKLCHFKMEIFFIPIYGKNVLSQVKGGLINGEVFSLSIWSNKKNSEH